MDHSAFPGAPDDLHFLPLGGSGEIGMNLNLYGYRGSWLMVDLGVTFGNEETPGIDVMMPDPRFIVERRNRLAGLVLTHAHEDHLGAVPYLWDRLRCPVYATPFTAALLRRKLADDGREQVPITEVPLSARFDVGPFDLELISLTHSIPEPNAIAIRTAQGTVLHTGDWKFDPDPLLGPTADEAALRRLGDEGVLALVGDSTNALRPGESGSEGDVRAALLELVRGCRNRVAVACFASNVARLQSIADVAELSGRDIALVGRSLWRIVGAARESGYIEPDAAFLNDRDAAYLPRDRALLVCTGSQGEPRAALTRIARGDHPSVVLEEGDTAIFSSRIIPGNERSIGRLQDDLLKRGVEVMTERDHFVHVSGHPCRDELVRMYQWVRPRIAIPVHGEHRHMVAHADLARTCQVQETIVPTNGTLIRLAPGPAAVVGQVHAGRLALEGDTLVPLDSPALKTRGKIAVEGVVVATVVVDRAGKLVAEPRLAAPGLYDPEDDADAIADLVEALRRAVAAAPANVRRDDAALEEAVRRALRKAVRAGRGKRPVVDLHLVRV